jgi:site-specific recombinase XerD
VRRRRAEGEALYWSADSLSTRAADYPERWIALPRGATAAEIADLCETYAARLAAWLDRGLRPRFLYDGTIGSLCDAFERHPQSPICDVRPNTADSYRDSLKVIRATVAKRAVRALAPIDVKAWYARWRAPREDGAPERVKRAHDAVAALRMILRFGQAMGYEECGKLAEGLKAIQFERSKPRQAEMTIDHARAFIAAALGLERQPRGLYMAIGVAAQFETMLRQKDVIGEWRADAAGRESWLGSFTWENIPGGILRLTTSKTNSAGVYDLTRLDLLWPLLQRAPQAERRGAIVKGELGAPIRERSYRKWFRQIARRAGVPDSVWAMDARAGAVTEALEAGADLTAVQRAATHSSPAMTARYDRANEEAVVTVAEARKKARNR